MDIALILGPVFWHGLGEQRAFPCNPVFEETQTQPRLEGYNDQALARKLADHIVEAEHSSGRHDVVNRSLHRPLLGVACLRD